MVIYHMRRIGGGSAVMKARPVKRRVIDPLLTANKYLGEEMGNISFSSAIATPKTVQSTYVKLLLKPLHMYCRGSVLERQHCLEEVEHVSLLYEGNFYQK